MLYFRAGLWYQFSRTGVIDISRLPTDWLETVDHPGPGARIECGTTFTPSLNYHA